MDVGVNALSAIISAWVDNEAVVGVDVSRLVNGVVARTQAPGRISAIVPTIAVRVMVVVLWSWGQTEVHQVSDGRLPFAVVEWTHGERLNNSILVGLPEALRALVLLLALLVVAWRGRGATRSTRSGATPLLAEEVDGVERWLDLRRGGWARGC